MKTSDFAYDLPPERIAQTPIEPRDHSRMLVLDRKTGKYQDKHFYDILSFLKKGDCLILNDSRVLPARLYGIREKTGTGRLFPASGPCMLLFQSANMGVDR